MGIWNIYVGNNLEIDARLSISNCQFESPIGWMIHIPFPDGVPKMGLPPSHPSFNGFSIINHPCLICSMYGTLTHMCPENHPQSGSNIPYMEHMGFLWYIITQHSNGYTWHICWTNTYGPMVQQTTGWSGQRLAQAFQPQAPGQAPGQEASPAWAEDEAPLRGENGEIHI